MSIYSIQITEFIYKYKYSFNMMAVQIFVRVMMTTAIIINDNDLLFVLFLSNFIFVSNLKKKKMFSSNVLNFFYFL